MSRSEHLLLPRQFHDAMIQHAQAELPNECCGVLAGLPLERFFFLFPHHKKASVRTNELSVQAWYPLVNEAASPIEYRSEPHSMFQAIKDMGKRDQEIVAIYHSHPTSAPSPSQTDLERHFSTEVVHFIIGLEDPTPLVRGWWLTEKSFEEAVWQIVEA